MCAKYARTARHATAFAVNSPIGYKILVQSRCSTFFLFSLPLPENTSKERERKIKADDVLVNV